MKSQTTILTPLGTFKSKLVHNANEPEFITYQETLKEQINNLKYLSFTTENDEHLIFPKEILHNSILSFKLHK